MSHYKEILESAFSKAIYKIYGIEPDISKMGINPTRKEFEGDYTIVLFPYLKILKTNPIELGEKLGTFFVTNIDCIVGYSLVKGFLNLSFSEDFWKGNLIEINKKSDYGRKKKNGKKVMVEFSSPNTNKPLHLGHIRNILLGWSCSEILEEVGYEVVKTQIVNDRGIAVCKSMLAWQLFGNGSTPESEGVKSDHYVGKYYVKFEQEFQSEYLKWQLSDEAQKILNQQTENIAHKTFFKKFKNEYFNKFSTLGRQAREMLIKWENGEEEVRGLWRKMNEWVYDGFEKTYQSLGVEFDKLYYESDTYLLGKEVIALGDDLGVIEKRQDGSAWVDLTDEGYDHKLLLRSDGTSVYMTQDIGTALQRYKDFAFEKMIYVVGDEQDYHFQALFEILKKLQQPYADQLYHLSYGMVDLPEGRMKSREGTVVDADDLVQEVINEARNSAEERGEMPSPDPEESQEILQTIGLGALKFFITKVSPKKRMVFNPQESVDMQGQTGPYVQNAYVRIRSILRRAEEHIDIDFKGYIINEDEKYLISQLLEYPEIVEDAAHNYEPSTIANFAYNLAKSFHKFYHDYRILGAETESAKNFRLVLITNIAKVLKRSFKLLGINMPERM